MAATASHSTTSALSFDAILAQSHHRHRLHLLSPSSSLSRPSPFVFQKSQHPQPCLSLHTTKNHGQPKSVRPTSTPSSLPTTETSLSFLNPDAVQRLQLLEEYRYRHVFDDGSSLEVRLMASEDVDATVQLLAGSFADSIWIPGRYVSLLAFLVKQYMLEKRRVLPHAATLVGFYNKGGDFGGEEEEVEGPAATAEISFNALGTNASLPTPLPPRDCPYICNMTVRKELRRKRLGSHLLSACEELISLMSEKQEVYLHCRVIDQIPYNMYRKAGYRIVKTDNILVWLSFQRRKNLMCKKLPSNVVTEFKEQAFQ